MPDESSILYGKYGGNLIRAGLPTWPHTIYSLRYENTNLGAGALDITIDTVPTSTVRIITHCAFYYAGTSPVTYQVTYLRSGSYHLFAGKKSPVTQEMYVFPLWIMTQAADQYRLIIQNATAGNDTYVWLAGFDMSLAV